MDEKSQPTYKLYSPGQIVVAILLASPMAGIHLLASNWRKLGKTDTADNAVTWGWILIIVVLGLLTTISPILENSPFSVSLKYWVYVVAPTLIYGKTIRLVERSDYDKHIRQGGERASNWHVVGLSFVVLVGVCTIAIIFAVIVSFFSA